MLPDIRQFVEILPEPSFLLTTTGEIVLANASMARLTGRERQSLIGNQLFDLLSARPERFRDYLRFCARSRQFLPGSIRLNVSGAGAMDLRCDGAVIEPRTGNSPGLIFLRCRPRAEASDRFALLNRKIGDLSREVLERRKAERERDESLRSERTARLEAERISRMKDEFLATLSHELRTPLHAILGWTSILEREKLPESAEKGLEVIARNARVQTQLIEDLLDMSRIVSGKIRLDVQPVDLRGVIEEAMAGVQPAADAKGVRLQVTFDPTVGPVKGDPSRLQQVVWNLLSNAVKFTGGGGRVRVALERVQSHVEISVSDSGAGIKPEFLPHVFDRFQQADSSTTRRYGGLGLGLSIAKQLVELHGGTIGARSAGLGQGSSFRVALPFLPLPIPEEASADLRIHPHTSSAPPEYDPCMAQDLTGCVILLVEDESDARVLVQKMLENCKAVVWSVASAAEALGLLGQKRPDIVISDIGMPDLDGYQFIREVRAGIEAHKARIPAIALTAFSRSDDRMRAMLAGYDLHLSKPVEPRELIVAVAKLLERSGGRRHSATGE